MLKHKSHILILFFISFFCLSANDGAVSNDSGNLKEELAKQEEWIETTFNSMTLEEQIAQLIIIRAHSDLGADHIASVEKTISQYQVGGLCFFQGTPEKQTELTNQYQALAKVPMMVTMDAEWGLGMRFKEDGFSFPKQLMLGAIQDNRLLYDMGKEVARQCKRIGVHVNFAPVADVNNNPKNPVINTRSFGEDRYNVAAKSYMYMKGMQDGGIMACAKHFPGHGDTDVDSHYDLPIINHNTQRLDSIELFPFKILAEQNVQSMMVAHLHVPSIDNTPNMPTSLSGKAITDILKEDLNFEGIIFTDGLEMEGVAKHHESGQVEVKALQAGSDVLLLPKSISAAIRAIKKAIDTGSISKERLDYSVKKVLKYKYQLGLSSFTPLSRSNVRYELETPEAKILKRELIENALTLVRNNEFLIPFQNLEEQKIASLSIGASSTTPFQKRLSSYTDVKHFNAAKDLSSYKHQDLLNQLSKYKTVIVGIHDMNSSARKGFGVTVKTKNFLQDLKARTKVVLVVFGNPYSLKYFDSFDHLVEAYDDNEITQDATAQGLFGAFSFRGKLPVTASPSAKFNDGITTPKLFRMGYSLPESVGLDSRVLTRIDALAIDAVQTKSTPGCVVLVAKDGKVVYEKAFGHHTYSKKRRMKTDDIFDLASITKVAASTVSTMKLHEQGKINIYNKMSQYLPDLVNTNKKDIAVHDMMTHHAALHPWIPFFEQTVSSKKYPLPKYYSKTPKEGFSRKVTEKLYMKDDFVNEMWQQIYDSELRPNKEYKYSDLGFFMVGDMVGKVSGKPLEKYAAENFYKPLGLSTTTFNPWKEHEISRIVPSEDDKYWRRQKVQGYVHDMGAAMLGGVSGHAGLFSSANDLAILMQMILNGGYYGGERFLDSETIQTFTNRCPDCTRRGIGFDMLQTNKNLSQNLSQKASLSTYGHLGFTGTCTWVDPENNIVYVFLSNRTYPSMKNYKLSEKDYRPNIQSIIYDALIK